MGFFLVLLIVMLTAGCEAPGEFSDEPADLDSGAGLAILLPGAPGGTSRAVTDPGNIGHDSVQRLLTYVVSLSGPGGRTQSKEAGYGRILNFDNLEPGRWTITTNAFFRSHWNLQANDPASTEAPPQTVTLAAGKTSEVPVALELAAALKNKILIADAAAFKKIGDLPAAGGWQGEERSFLLLTDLTLDNWAGPAIHGASITNRAEFDGGGHTIRINSFGGAVNYGLFTDAYRADISGLNIVLNIANGPADAGTVGGLTALGSDATIKNVHVSGTLHITSNVSSGSYAGGIAGGLSSGDVTFCSSKLDLKLTYTGTGAGSAGGLVGELGFNTSVAIIYDSFFSGTVEGPISGGIAGKTGGASAVTNIKNCYSAGTVKGSKNIGGIAGIFDGPAFSGITGCYSSTKVEGDGAGGYAGGIVGSIESGVGFFIEDCLALNKGITGINGWLRAYQVYGILSGTGTLNNKTIGIIIDCENNPSDAGAVSPAAPWGDVLTLGDPPEQADFSSSGFYFDSSSESFAMPPEGWDYDYPVFNWQIGFKWGFVEDANEDGKDIKP